MRHPGFGSSCISYSNSSRSGPFSFIPPIISEHAPRLQLRMENGEEFPLSVSAARCHLSRGERQERSNAGVCLYKAGRRGRRPLHAQPLREHTCRGRPPDVPRNITHGTMIHTRPEGAPHLQKISPFPGEGGQGDGATPRQNGSRAASVFEAARPEGGIFQISARGD